MDIVSVVFAQLFFLLILGAIGGIIWFAYQANLQQQQKTSRGARGSDRKERSDRKQPKASRQAPAPVPEPEPEQKDEEESEAEAEPEPEPVPAAKKGNKKNKKKPAEEKKAPTPAPEKKPQAKAAPVPAAPAKKAAQKASAAPAQKAPAAAAKKPVEEKKEAKPEQKAKKDKTDKKKELQKQQDDFVASLAALQKKGNAAKTQDTEAGWTKSVSKASKRSANKEETKLSATAISLQIQAKQYPLLIGAKGSTLKKITEHSGAEINIEKSNRKDLQADIPIGVSIKGNPANCAVAEALIKELLAEGFTSITHPGFVSTSYKLRSPDRDRALIVGQKGANIKKLQERCNVRIHLPVGRDSNEIHIVGLEQACKKAAEAIDTLLREGYSTVTHEGYVRGEVEGVSPSQYPAIIGKKGETIAKIQEATRTKITVPNNDNGLVNVAIVGPADGVNKAREMILEALSKDVASPVVEDDNPNNPWAAVNVNANDDWS